MAPRDEPPPTLRDLLRFYREAGVDEALEEEAVNRFAPLFSPLEGEMAAKQPEGVRAAVLGEEEAMRPAERTPPGRYAATLPSRGRESSPPPLSIPDEAQAARARELAREAKTLTELRDILSGFDGCNLKFTAKNLVFGDGNPAAPVMFVGEAPGRDEDIEGLPFVGRSGQLLDRMLAAIGRNRNSAYIANVIPWRPPGNRAPTPLETEICRPFIERQIALVDPDFLVLLGGAASKQILRTEQGISKLRGRWRDYDTGKRTIRALATLHPAYLLRTPAQKRYAWRDFLMLKAALAGRG
jgi:uracil-DNA glycosylase